MRTYHVRTTSAQHWEGLSACLLSRLNGLFDHEPMCLSLAITETHHADFAYGGVLYCGPENSSSDVLNAIFSQMS